MGTREERKRQKWREANQRWRATRTPEQIEKGRESHRKWRARMTPEQVRARREAGRKRYRENLDAERGRRLKRRFGMTLEDWDTMFEAQGGKCALCLQVPTSTLHVDHCHETGRIRSLLCSHCNKLLGIVERYSGLIEQMRNYLRGHK